jgi:hypothetical protein
MMETPMNTSTNARDDRSPAESDPELAGVLSLLDTLAAAERASAPASLESRVSDASSPELGLAIEPLPITPARQRTPMRLAAAIALGAVALSVWVASLSSKPTPAELADATETGAEPAATVVLADARAASVRDWAAVSSLYEDNLGTEIDILSAEVSRLGSSLADAPEASDSSLSGGAF